MALHDATGGSTAGLLAWASWTAQKHANAQDACATAWKSFTLGRGITIATLIAHARRRGFDPYARKRQSKANGHAPEPPPPGSEQDYGFATRTRPDDDPGGTPGTTPGGKPGPFDDPIENDLYRHSMDEPLVPTPILVDSLILGETAGILTGVGGVGKSILAQVLATCVASPDKPFLGRKTEHGRAVYVTGEDPRNEVHNRQDRITTALGLTKEDVADSLVLKSVTNEDIFLFSNGKPTLLAAKFVMWLEGLGRLRLVCIDSAALVYNDTEIDRRVVTAFLRFLNRMAERLKCTVILLTHPSRTSDGSVERMSSGSTAWSFGSRFGLLMQNDDGAVSVAALKGNYMAPGLKIDLEWRDGVLLDKGADGIVENIQRNADDKAVLDAIRRGGTAPAIRSRSRPERKGATCPASWRPRMAGRRPVPQRRCSGCSMPRRSKWPSTTKGENCTD